MRERSLRILGPDANRYGTTVAGLGEEAIDHPVELGLLAELSEDFRIVQRFAGVDEGKSGDALLFDLGHVVGGVNLRFRVALDDFDKVVGKLAREFGSRTWASIKRQDGNSHVQQCTARPDIPADRESDAGSDDQNERTHLPA